MVEPYSDVVDGWVVVCGCGLMVRFSCRGDAEERRAAHERGVDE